MPAGSLARDGRDRCLETASAESLLRASALLGSNVLGCVTCVAEVLLIARGGQEIRLAGNPFHRPDPGGPASGWAGANSGQIRSSSPKLGFTADNFQRPIMSAAWDLRAGLACPQHGRTGKGSVASCASSDSPRPASAN